ncbi:nucleotidyltransferase family protein [Pendulispora rubella]|uniref:Nucleotidyltransferase family protein n=1 Tax=Pendulispora rubella TaxID=2741070 RepID=A0ABZ2L8N9_9BACT
MSSSPLHIPRYAERACSAPPHASHVLVSEAFYARVLGDLTHANVPFLAGGSYALMQYCHLFRKTKDLDLFVRRRDLEAVLGVLRGSGCWTEVPFPHWLAKAHQDGQFVDIIFNSGNGLTAVDDDWFEHATSTTLFGVDVLLCPMEETIWSKSFVMERERFDGADIAHLIVAQGHRLDWERLLRRFASRWPVLLGHLIFYGFIYPDEPTVPEWVMEELFRRAREDVALRHAVRTQRRMCRGTLLSREQYLPDLGRGFLDARLPPYGTMSAHTIAIWTEAIRKNR